MVAMVSHSNLHGIVWILLVFPFCLLACPPPEQYMIPREQAAAIQFDGDPKIYENSSSHLDRRFFNIAPTTGGGTFWPGNVITYCYADNNAMTALEPNLRSAWDLWQMNGLADRIQFNQGTDSDCLASNAANVLTVFLAPTATLITSLGKQPIDAATGRASTMTLNPSVNIGMEDPVANYAHEIGHAFGLIHEHQRPDVWGPFYGGTGAVDQFIFNCANMADYQAKVATQGTGIQTICTYRAAALLVGFSGAEILPILNLAGVRYNAGDVDFDSIMMYASIVGGIGAGANRQVVYTRGDGSLIPYNPRPSASDVNNLNALYPATAPRATPCFLWQPCSIFQSAFQGITGCFTGN